MNLPEIFGNMVFNDKAMRKWLPKDTYSSLKETIASGKELDIAIAKIVANAMKEWAIEKGATHYTHWFQPLNGATAEKHDSFIRQGEADGIIMDFSGKELIKGEPDASSFPSGGLRVTFEARGYTAWDPTSYAFIKDKTLYIPTAFCSYSGYALDLKTPLLRSIEAFETQAERILKFFSDDNVRATSTVGAEQEYFLIDKEVFLKRPDLIHCGRTLFGAKPPKGQELDDHYFGSIKPRVLDFMNQLDEELWKLGVLAKTEHNEAAPAQHELAPIFTTCNVACDHNFLTMDMMKLIADKHGLACLLHEKPFAGVNGSGKHNNWSITTDKGENILSPGATPSQNTRFMLFLVAVIKAVDDYQDLLRFSIASAGNDHRLGAAEAPPAIVSVFLGDELTSIFEHIANDEIHEDWTKSKIQTGARVLPNLSKDTTDRNRTSPFAFTGNKFEFRMLGSATSVAGSNIVINTIVAESLRQFADYIEKADDTEIAINEIISTAIKMHKRIIFNGNNYSNEWVEQAKERGLLNLETTVDAVLSFPTKRNIDLFKTHGVYSEMEIRSQFEIKLESYSKTIMIEALTMVDMVKKGVIPGILEYQQTIANSAALKKVVDQNCSSLLEKSLLNKISKLADEISVKLEQLEQSVSDQPKFINALEQAEYHKNVILQGMNNLRISVDGAESEIGKRYWEYPTYSEMLYSV